MKHLISAMFDEYAAATAAVERLTAAGIPQDDISIVGGSEEVRASSSGSDDESSGAGTGATTGAILGGGAGLLAGLGLLAIPGLGPVVAAGWLASTLLGVAAGGVAGGLIGALTGGGMSEEEAHSYAEGIRRGGTLVTVRAEEAMVDRAVDILDDEGTVDMEERTANWRNEGWSGTFEEGSSRPVSETASGRPGTAGDRSHMGSQPTGQTGSDSQSIPVVEEQLDVGKRKVTSGRVRVHSRTASEPVETPVRLRDETVRVERTPVDKPVGTSGTMQPDRVIEEMETREVPVVEKQGRIVEEVRVSKQARDRTEVVKDDVKKTDVEVEDTRGTEADKASGRKA